ncbi:MAG: patatin-like phospholipase family protein [Acidimicrobiales bacterium]
MTPPGKTAFVLAGGGAKGAFEAGAVCYLVEEAGIIPQIITATSVGSICAAVLAQARTHEEFVRRVDELRSDLLAMTSTDLVFGKQPWVDALDGTPLGTAIDRFVVERTRPPPPEIGTTLADRPRNPTVGTPWRRRGAFLRDGVRVLPKIGTARRHLRGNSSSLLTLDPLAQALRHGGPSGIRAVDPELIGRPGLELRLAVAALGHGVLRYVTGTGRIVESDAVTEVAGSDADRVDVIDGVLASASVPMIFPPRRMADDVYVDGGVANNIPVEAAVRLGADRVFALLAVPLVQASDPRDFTQVSGLSVFLRAVGAVSFAERQWANLNPPLPAGVNVTVIDPLVDVVGPFEVAQGLMLLDMDYGWLRASDVIADVDNAIRSRAMELTDTIVVARTEAWHREESMWATGSANAADREALASTKDVVREALVERRALGLAVPSGANSWWEDYETHQRPRPASLAPRPRMDPGRNAARSRTAHQEF